MNPGAGSDPPAAPMLYLIDGHAQFFRAYHAIRSGMTSPVTHEPTNLTFGFTGLLLKLLRDYRPDHVAVVVDASGDRGTFRSEIDPQYKANREEAPDDFAPQVQRCISMLQTMGIPVLAMEGVEADDVIASLVRRIRREHPEVRIRIISRDKDLTQLLDDRVELFDLQKDSAVGTADVFGVEGIEPAQVADALALMGDTSDNVPGVPGIGPVTAAKLILQYGSIDGIYRHLGELSPKRREALESARERVRLSRRLVELRDDLDVTLPLEAARFRTSDLPVDRLVPVFRELGFNTHAESLRSIAAGGGAGAALAPTTVAQPPAGARRRGGSAVADEPLGGLFADVARRDAGAPPAAETSGTAAPDPSTGIVSTCIRTADALRALVGRIRRAGRVSIDTETDSLAPRRARLCGVSLAIGPDEGWYVPTRSPDPSSHMDAGDALSILRPVLEDPAISKIGHNLKFDLNVLRAHGVMVEGTLFDTMVASYVVDATRSSHRLDVLALALLGHVCIPITDLIGSGRGQRTFDHVPLEQAVPYAVEDAVVAWRLAEILAPQIEREGLGTLARDTEMPLVRVLAELEYNGIRVDPDELERQRVRLEARAADLRATIAAAAPHPFNPDSPRQLAAALFNAPDASPPGLGLKVIRRGKTGPSTDQEVLERLADDPLVQVELPALILEYRQLTKLVGTYLVGLREAIDPGTGRIHASFNQTVAATGRLSSSDPNLQNIPIRTGLGREIRRAFVADPDHLLLTADYSQIELRILAHLSRDEALRAAFRSGADIHRAVAAEVFGVDPEAVTDQQRGAAKMVNFGIVYGITAFGLARRLGGRISNTEAQAIIDSYRQRYAGIGTFLAECVHAAVDRGFVETILGRRRRIPEIHDRTPMRRALGERMAINTVVQGSAADLIKIAMIDLHRVLPQRAPGVRMLLQIHDELVFEVPARMRSQAERVVRERMEQAMSLSVPLVVDTAASHCWIDAH